MLVNLRTRTHVKNILKKYVSGVNEGSEFSKISVIFSRSFGRQGVSSFCYFLKRHFHP